ncbi:MAG: formylglycine-generating enzyme family protein [Gemmatimonadota bacterium]|nr:formylglycine-generating enzyme family protein [Gemmatimonadota bacterium]
MFLSLSVVEWEYAARAGTTTRYSWGDEIVSNLANCDGCGGRWDDESTAPVGSFPANAWGLNDMHGNVWEWVQDCWNGSYSGAPADGSAWESGDCSSRVLRGGSWNLPPQYLRAAYRSRFDIEFRVGYHGFRVARTLSP